MNQPTSQPETRQAVPSRRLTRTEKTTQEGHHQPMQTHLSAKLPAEPKSDTHLCITIRWWAAPPRDLPVALGGAAADRLATGGVRCLAATGSALRALAARGGGVAC
jgi:hypothetical protein